MSSMFTCALGASNTSEAGAATSAPQCRPADAGAGTVVYYDNGRASGFDVHERVTLVHLARCVAPLLGYRFGGAYDATCRPPSHVYFVPRDTLLADEARALGVSRGDDLYGGIVPHDVLRTKAIMHPLLDDRAHSAPGWSTEFSSQVADLVLPGFTAFTKNDVRRACWVLLIYGPVRLKLGIGCGGHGQTVVRSVTDMDAALDGLSEAEIAASGVVVEIDLVRPVTYGVGQVRIGAHRISYYGKQRTTTDNSGQVVYGGSELRVVAGDFNDLLAHTRAHAIRSAIHQARRLHEAVEQAFPELIVSRINYDVIRGTDCRGQRHSGVLEQSWRVGGASPAEIAALEAFDDDPSRRTVRVSAIEQYGDGAPPPHARIYYQGVDPRLGPLTKFTLTESDENPR